MFESPAANKKIILIVISIISKVEFNSDWSRSSDYGAIFTALGVEYCI